MKNTKAFTLVEILVVISIMWLMTWAVSLWINSFWTSTELINTENLIKLKIRSEKIWILSGQYHCSQINLLNWMDYFTILNSKIDWDYCEKMFFGYLNVKNRKIVIQNLKDGNSVEVLELWDKFSNVDYNNIEGEISFPIQSWRSYRIISSNEDEKEELEINFYNIQRNTLDINDPKIVTVDDISWVNFRKEILKSSILKIVFQAPKPDAKMYLHNNQRVNDVEIIMKNWIDEEKRFNIFSAFLSVFKRYHSFDLEI